MYIQGLIFRLYRACFPWIVRRLSGYFVPRHSKSFLAFLRRVFEISPDKNDIKSFFRLCHRSAVIWAGYARVMGGQMYLSCRYL